MKRYGQLSVEELAAEKLQCRQIVDEVVKFGITQRQQALLIYMLALELEDVTKMQQITSFIREIYGPELFLVDRADE